MKSVHLINVIKYVNTYLNTSGGFIKGRRRRAPPLIENHIPDAES